MNIKSPKALQIDHVRSDGGAVVIKLRDKIERVYETKLDAGMVTHFLAMMRAALEKAVPESADKSFPLNILKIEVGEAVTSEGVRQGMRIFVTGDLHHDYYFAPGSDQREFILDALLKETRGYGILDLPPKKKQH